MQKIRYEIDPHNRLTARGPDKFRQVLDGTFKLADGNALVYHVKKSDNTDVPQEIRFTGDWSLGKNHDLALTLDKWNNRVEGNKLIFKSALADAGSNELLFSVETRESSRKTRINILKFSGAWQADAQNRLMFLAEKKTGSADPLILQGTWEVNKRNEIVYKHPENSITLRGYWRIAGKNKITYVLNKRLGSYLDFTAGFERAESDSLRYGIGVGRGKRKRVVSLWGRWKMAKGAGLFFEVKHAIGGVKVEAELTKAFLAGRGEGFIKALASEKEFAIMGGAGLRW